MPTYEFACQSCGESFEELLGSVADADAVVCPRCGSANVKRKISWFGAIGGGRRASSAPACAPGGG